MPQIQALDLNALVERACALLGRVLDARILLRVDTEPELLPVLGDPGLLEQMLDRLALQEADALLKQGGGTLAFRTLRLKDGRALLRIQRLPATPAPPQGETGQRQRLLEDIQEVHGAELLQDGPTEEGWILDLLLPACIEEAHPAEPVPLARLDGLRILVAEDEPEMRYFMREILRRMGAEVVSTVDGEEAWTRWNQEGPFDLLITDHRMPRLSGLELLNRVRADHPSFPVVITSGYGKEEFDPILEQDPRLRYLAKPFMVRTLLGVVGELLAKASPPA